MSGTSVFQPKSVILNSKYRQSYEGNSDVTYQLIQPIHAVQRARISEFTTVYLANLVREDQASLKFNLYTDVGALDYSYDISLDSLTENYYETITEVVTDIQAIMDALFVDTGGNKFSVLYKPTITYNTTKRNITVSWLGLNTYTTEIISDNSTFWYKLGFPNGVTEKARIHEAPSYPSVLPLNELYIEIGGMTSENTLLRTENSSYHNNTKIAQVVTFADTRLGDLYSFVGRTVPEYPLIPNESVQNIRVRLLDSTGNVVPNLKADYRLTLDFMY